MPELRETVNHTLDSIRWCWLESRQAGRLDGGVWPKRLADRRDSTNPEHWGDDGLAAIYARNTRRWISWTEEHPELHEWAILYRQAHFDVSAAAATDPEWLAAVDAGHVGYDLLAEMWHAKSALPEQFSAFEASLPLKSREKILNYRHAVQEGEADRRKWADAHAHQCGRHGEHACSRIFEWPDEFVLLQRKGGTTWPALVEFSERAVTLGAHTLVDLTFTDALEDAGISGWSTVQVPLFDREWSRRDSHRLLLVHNTAVGATPLNAYEHVWAMEHGIVEPCGGALFRPALSGRLEARDTVVGGLLASPTAAAKLAAAGLRGVKLVQLPFVDEVPLLGTE